MLNGFHHVCVKTRDWDRTVWFYRDLLGMPVKLSWRTAPQRAAMFDAGAGDYIEVFEDLAYAGAPNGTILHFALRTGDVLGVVARMRAAGVKITMEPKALTLQNTTDVGPVPIQVAFCEGPNGESVEFFQNELT